MSALHHVYKLVEDIDLPVPVQKVGTNVPDDAARRQSLRIPIDAMLETPRVKSKASRRRRHTDETRNSHSKVPRPHHTTDK